jgi:hypothetical protein
VSDFYIPEPTGIFEAELLEDMVVTVSTVKKPFIRCKIPAVFGENLVETPLVYLPIWHRVLPLREGDKVMVKFSQNSPQFPYLWRPTKDYEIPAGMFEKFPMPDDGELVSFPEATETISSVFINTDFYILSTDEYVLLHTKDTVQILSPNEVTFFTPLFQILSEAVKVEVKNAFDVKTKTMVIEALSSLEFKVGSSSIKLEPAKMTFSTPLAESTGVCSPKQGGFLCSFPIDCFSGTIQTG